MAGKDTVQDILHKNAETLQLEEQNKVQKMENFEENNAEQNGTYGNEKAAVNTDVNSLHPVAAMQVIFVC